MAISQEEMEDEIDRIALKLLKSKIGTKAILKAAQRPKNPLHQMFDWSNYDVEMQYEKAQELINQLWR